jgi:hypothetical protein
MVAKKCQQCGAKTFKEYSMAMNGGRRLKVVEAWLCGNECAEKYFGERVED